MQAGGGQAVQWGRVDMKQRGVGNRTQHLLLDLAAVPRSFCSFLEDVLQASQIIRCLPAQSNEGNRKEWIISDKVAMFS